MSTELTIKQAQTEVDNWIKTVGVRYFNELTNLGILMEEVGELSRLMVRKYGEQSFKETDNHFAGFYKIVLSETPGGIHNAAGNEIQCHTC